MDAERELVDVGLLATEIEDANLGVGYTTVEARLRVRLLSMTVSGMLSLVVVVLFPSPHAPIPPSFALQVFQWVSSVCGGRQSISYLVLAVAVTSRGTTGHFDGISVVDLGVGEARSEEAWASISSGARRSETAKAELLIGNQVGRRQRECPKSRARSESVESPGKVKRRMMASLEQLWLIFLYQRTIA